MTFNKYALEDKVVLLTGGSSGIGRAIAQAFLENGAKVAVIGRRDDNLQETIEGYPESHAFKIVKDISKPEAAQEIVRDVKNKFGQIDIVVSDAGVYANGPIDQTADSEWENLRQTNIDAFFYLAKASYEALKETQGTLIATSSVSGFNGDWNQVIYNASKHAITGFVRSLALDWGKDNIRVNAVAPAFTMTPMTEDMTKTKDELKPFINRIALGRPGKPKDIAPAVLFLTSEDAEYITGTVLTVDGGTSASTGQPHVE